MSLPLRRRLRSAVLATLLALVAIWLLSQRSVSRLARVAREVERTHAMTRTVEQSYGQLAAAESHARGYFLTADPAHMAAYEAAAASARARLAALRVLTAWDVREHRRAQRLAELAERRFAMLSSTMRLRGDSGLAAVAGPGRAGAGAGDRVVMDSIRGEVDAMRAEGDALLAQSSVVEAANAGRAMQVMTLGFLLAPVLSGIVALMMRRDIGEQTRVARALEDAKEQADEARARAEQASRAKSDFLARMSHELRTPLNSIIGFSNVLLKNRSSVLRAPDLVYLQRIVANGKQLLALINDILDLSKVEAGRVQLERGPVALDELISDLIAGFEGQLQEREGITLTAELPSPVETIEADAGKLQQVLMNLIGNAVKFTEHGQVTVRMMVDPDTRAPVRVDVCDTGVGIPPDRREAVFEAFEQADAGVARRYGGTGLGLAIARSLCTAMGYELETHANPGGGSVFSVHLSPGTEEARRGAQTPVSLYRITEESTRDVARTGGGTA